MRAVVWSEQMRQIFPEGVHAARKLVGTPTLPDTLAATRVHGTVCFTGMLSNEWIVPNFYPIAYLPKGVRLTAYGGESADLPADVLQSYLDKIASGKTPLGPTNVSAHQRMGPCVTLVKASGHQ